LLDIKYKSRIFILVLIYLFNISIRIYWLSQKNGLFIDEALSYSLCFVKNQGLFEDFDINREYTGLELKETGFISLNTGIKETLHDIYILWKDNKDVPHTSLYYILLRLFCIKLKSADLNDIIFRGGLLNLIVFTMSFFSFYQLIKIIFPHSKFAQYTGLMCAYMLPASISNTMYIRPYQLQETMYILLVYYLVKTLEYSHQVIDRKNKRITGQFIKFVVIMAFTLLTGYYSLIFIGLWGIYTIYVKYKEKKYREIKYYLLVFLCGILCARLFYLSYFNAFITYRTIEITTMISHNYWQNIKISFESMVRILRVYIMTWPYILLCAICAVIVLSIILRKQKININRKAVVIAGIVIIYMAIIMYIAPYKVLRYVMPVSIFFILLPIMFLEQVKQRYKMASVLLVSMLIIGMLPDALNYDKIEYVYTNEYDFQYTKDYNVPVYIGTMTSNFAIGYIMYGYIVPYLHNQQIYIFIDAIDEINIKKYNEAYIIYNWYNVKETEINNYDMVNNYYTVMPDDNLDKTSQWGLSYTKIKKHDRTPYEQLREELLQISRMFAE